MSEAKAGGTVSTYTVIGNVDASGKAQSLATSPLSVESTPATISGTPTYDSFGNPLTWTQDGIAYVATYDASGNLLTQGRA